MSADKKRVNKKQLFMWSGIAISALLTLSVFVFVAHQFIYGGSIFGGYRSGDSSADAGNKWKFAEDIQSGVLYPVVHVIDGDTIIVRATDPGALQSTDNPSLSVHDVTIRLIGIDTPETVDPRKPVQCFGPEASTQGKDMLASTSVYLEKDPTKGDYDKYGRVLAYVRMPDGTLYNDYMLENGFAREYTYFDQLYKYQSRFKSEEAAAKKARLGLWGKC